MTDVTTTRDQEIHDLLDKQAIHETIMRYCRGVDRCDPDLISSAYHPDAIDEHGNHNYTGATVGQGIADRLRASTTLGMHHVTNQVIQLHGDGTAGCESYWAVWQTEDADGRERTIQAVGRYIDRFERRDGEWKIAHRLVVTELARELPSAGSNPQARFGLGSRDHDDPSYAVLNS